VFTLARERVFSSRGGEKEPRPFSFVPDKKKTSLGATWLMGGGKEKGKKTEAR